MERRKKRKRKTNRHPDCASQLRPVDKPYAVLRPERKRAAGLHLPLRPLLCFACAIAMVFMLSSCGSSGSALPDLSSMGEITAVAREEGSGTASEFENLVDTNQEGADTYALSTQQVLSEVEDDENAIGYLAYSALGELSSDPVTVLSIDGVECSRETIANGKYPLSRDYILAYSGSLSELEQDFITYIRSAGQELVAQVCTPVRNSSVFLSNGEEGTITICGSSSMETLMELLIEGYYEYNPNAEIILEISDSTEGLNSAMRGECDLAMSSRSLESYEEELLEYYVIASDAIAVIVNSENPLTDISLSSLKSIYDGDVSVWSDLN